MSELRPEPARPAARRRPPPRDAVRPRTSRRHRRQDLALWGIATAVGLWFGLTAPSTSAVDPPPAETPTTAPAPPVTARTSLLGPAVGR
ncbi:MAG TPA: hypothetical protein VHK88_14135 [Aquihabitans sp.]|nr:hypothetical protein [Aquihabitans sp.]